MRWTDKEVEILSQYENTSKSAYNLYSEMNNKGFKRTFKSVTKKIENMGFRKPNRYVTGHETRLGYLDIESTGLKGNIDVMLSWCIKLRDKNVVKGDRVKKSELFKGEYDKRIVQSLLKEMKNYDLIFTYYGSGFDIPFIRTRALAHGIESPVYREISHKDIYYMVRSKLQLHRSSLQAACAHLNIRGKTNLDPKVWLRARYGDEDALDIVYSHNVADVKILERMHKKIEPYCPSTVVPL